MEEYNYKLLPHEEEEDDSNELDMKALYLEWKQIFNRSPEIQTAKIQHWLSRFNLHVTNFDLTRFKFRNWKQFINDQRNAAVAIIEKEVKEDGRKIEWKDLDFNAFVLEKATHNKKPLPDVNNRNFRQFILGHGVMLGISFNDLDDQAFLQLMWTIYQLGNQKQFDMSTLSFHEYQEWKYTLQRYPKIILPLVNAWFQVQFPDFHFILEEITLIQWQYYQSERTYNNHGFQPFPPSDRQWDLYTNLSPEQDQQFLEFWNGQQLGELESFLRTSHLSLPSSDLLSVNSRTIRFLWLVWHTKLTFPQTCVSLLSNTGWDIWRKNFKEEYIWSDLVLAQVNEWRKVFNIDLHSFNPYQHMEWQKFQWHETQHPQSSHYNKSTLMFEFPQVIQDEWVQWTLNEQRDWTPMIDFFDNQFPWIVNTFILPTTIWYLHRRYSKFLWLLWRQKSIVPLEELTYDRILASKVDKDQIRQFCQYFQYKYNGGLLHITQMQTFRWWVLCRSHERTYLQQPTTEYEYQIFDYTKHLDEEDQQLIKDGFPPDLQKFLRDHQLLFKHDLHNLAMPKFYAFLMILWRISQHNPDFDIRLFSVAKFNLWKIQYSVQIQQQELTKIQDWLSGKELSIKELDLKRFHLGNWQQFQLEQISGQKEKEEDELSISIYNAPLFDHVGESSLQQYAEFWELGDYGDLVGFLGEYDLLGPDFTINNHNYIIVYFLWTVWKRSLAADIDLTSLSFDHFSQWRKEEEGVDVGRVKEWADAFQVDFEEQEFDIEDFTFPQWQMMQLYYLLQGMDDSPDDLVQIKFPDKLEEEWNDWEKTKSQSWDDFILFIKDHHLVESSHHPKERFEQWEYRHIKFLWALWFLSTRYPTILKLTDFDLLAWTEWKDQIHRIQAIYKGVFNIEGFSFFDWQLHTMATFLRNQHTTLAALMKSQSIFMVQFIFPPELKSRWECWEYHRKKHWGKFIQFMESRHLVHNLEPWDFNHVKFLWLLWFLSLTTDAIQFKNLDKLAWDQWKTKIFEIQAMYKGVFNIKDFAFNEWQLFTWSTFLKNKSLTSSSLVLDSHSRMYHVCGHAKEMINLLFPDDLQGVWEQDIDDDDKWDKFISFMRINQLVDTNHPTQHFQQMDPLHVQFLWLLWYLNIQIDTFSLESFTLGAWGIWKKQIHLIQSMYHGIFSIETLTFQEWQIYLFIGQLKQQKQTVTTLLLPLKSQAYQVMFTIRQVQRNQRDLQCFGTRGIKT